MAEQSWPEIFFQEIEQTPEVDQARVIEAFVSERRAEDLYLDFVTKKDSTRGSLADDDSRNYAKAVSGFANSDGGVLIWGVLAKRQRPADDESPDVAELKQPISNLKAFHSNLNNWVRQATTPSVDGVRNIVVWDDKGQETGYVVTYVPQVTIPPYRATICNNNFYKRAGSRFYPMEPYDLRDVIFRQGYPKVHLSFDREDALIEHARHYYDLKVEVRNDGPSILELWKLVVEIPEVLIYPLDGDHRNAGFQEKSIVKGNQTFKKLTFTSHPHQSLYSKMFIPIFPEEEITLSSKDGPKRILYGITHEVYRNYLPLKIYWRFYAEGAPLQSGELEIKRSYQPGEQAFCNF